MLDVVTTTTTTATTLGAVRGYTAAGETAWFADHPANEPCGWIPNDSPMPVADAPENGLNGPAGHGTCGLDAAIPYVLTRAALAALHGGHR